MRVRRQSPPCSILSGSAAAILALTSSSFAVENFWTGLTSNNWNDPTNWSLGRVPTNTNGQPPPADPFDDAVINILANFPVITADLAATPRDIILGSVSGTNGRVDHRSGIVATGAGNWMFVGRDGGSGTYNLANTAGVGGTLTGFAQGSGSVNVGGRLYVGGFTGTVIDSMGVFNMNTTGTLAISNDLAIGSAGSVGLMNVDSGTITTGGWNFIGKNEGIGGGNGTLKMSGGTLTNNGARTFIGLGDSTGSLQISGGTYNNSALGSDNFFAIGVNNLNNPTTPTLTMTGGTLNAARTFSIGGVEPFGGNPDANFVGAGHGAVTINGDNARLNVFGEFWVGQNSGSQGELTVNAGTLAIDNWIVVGRGSSTGKITMTGGALTKTGGGHMLVGDGPGSTGTLILSGGAISLNTGELWVGQNTGTGQFDMSGGTLSVNNWTAIGRVGGTGTMNFTGGTFTKAGGGVFIIADPVGSNLPTTGILNQSGNSTLITNELWVGQGNGGNGTYTISSGSMTSSGWIAVGRERGTGTVELSGTAEIKKTGGGGTHIVIGSLSGTGVVNQTGGRMATEGGGDILLGEIQGDGAGSGTWNISGGTGEAVSMRIGWAGRPGAVNISGTGAVTMVAQPNDPDNQTGFVSVSQSAGDGTLTVSQNGSLQADHIHVGSSGGKGIVTQTGGTITTNRWIAVGIGSSLEAEYNLSGGTTNAVGFEVADTLGIVNISGTGVLNVTGPGIENPTRNGTGTFNISGGTVNTVSYQQGGRDLQIGIGVTNQTGGVVNITENLTVQRPNVGTGAYNLSGGTLAVNGAINGTLGTFTFTGGKITRTNPGVIRYDGNLTTGAPAATLGLDAGKTFLINGALNNTLGLTLELTGLAIPDQPAPLLAPVTGSFNLGMVTTAPAPGSFDIGKTFDVGFDATFEITGQGIITATRINEDAPFNPALQSVYWLDEDGGNVTLQYSIIPEPSSFALVTLAGLAVMGRRRRRK